MNDVVRALGIAAGILFLVVVLIVFITIAVVKRGEGEQLEAAHDLPDDSLKVKEAAVPQPAKAARPSAPAGEEISVMNILLFGTALFVLTIVVLLLLSLIDHRR